MGRRTEIYRAFAGEHGFPAEGWEALPGDASSRRYLRVGQTRFGPALLMDDPSETGSLAAFVRIARHLRELGLSAPAVHAADTGAGLALIEDFGADTYTRLLRQEHDETALYELATDVLVALHTSPRGAGADVPPYDMAALMTEVLLLPDWYAPAMYPERDFAPFRQEYETLWRHALRDVAQCREALVLRDYHVDNLMLLPARKGVAACGLLDFQDALAGSAAYDLMSLAQDARRDLSAGLEAHLLDRYFTARPDLDRGGFMRAYHLLAAQRHAKVAGIFLRLSVRDGKHNYLQHIPRVTRLLETALEAAGLGEIGQLMERHLPGWAGRMPPVATG